MGIGALKGANRRFLFFPDFFTLCSASALFNLDVCIHYFSLSTLCTGKILSDRKQCTHITNVTVLLNKLESLSVHIDTPVSHWIWPELMIERKCPGNPPTCIILDRSVYVDLFSTQFHLIILCHLCCRAMRVCLSQRTHWNCSVSVLHYQHHLCYAIPQRSAQPCKRQNI